MGVWRRLGYSACSQDDYQKRSRKQDAPENNERLDSSDWTPDELAKAAAAIQKLDKQTNLVTIIEVFAQYNNWLCSRMRLDPELTPELVGIMTKYQDIFINEHSNSMVEFKWSEYGRENDGKGSPPLLGKDKGTHNGH